MSLLTGFRPNSHPKQEVRVARKAPVLKTPEDYVKFCKDDPCGAYNMLCRSGIEQRATGELVPLQQQHLDARLQQILDEWSD